MFNLNIWINIFYINIYNLKIYFILILNVGNLILNVQLQN